MARALRLLQHPRFFWIAIGAAMLLALPTLEMGFFSDDYAFIAWFDGVTPRQRTPFNLYEFAAGDAAENLAMVRSGPWPWWSDPALQVRFFRPISSAMFFVDHALFGHDAVGYHAHALVWYFGLLVAVGLLLRCVLTPAVWPIAFLGFAISGHHLESVGWISARHMLIAATPAMAGLTAHVYARERGFRAGRWLAVVGMFVGLAGGEGALGALTFWLAYEAVGAPDTGDLRTRARHLAVPLAIAAVYFAFYKGTGYGTAHSDAYLDPLADPLRYLAAAAVRLPLLLGELVAGVPSAFGIMAPPAPFVVTGICVTLGFLALLRVVWPYVPASDQRALRWLGLGALLATLTTVGGFPGSRLLLLPGIGSYAAIAVIVSHIGKRLAASNDAPATTKPNGAPAKHEARASSPHSPLGLAARVGLRFGRGALVTVHFGLAPIVFLVMTQQLGKMGAQTVSINRSLDSELDLSGAKPRRIFVIASDPLAGLYSGAALAIRAPKAASAWSMLSMARATHRIERRDDRTLRITADPGFLYGSFEGVFRGENAPLHEGDAVTLDHAVVTVVATAHAHPTVIDVRFATKMDDPENLLLVWREGRLAPTQLPVGGRLEVPWSAGPTGFF